MYTCIHVYVLDQFHRLQYLNIYKKTHAIHWMHLIPAPGQSLLTTTLPFAHQMLCASRWGGRRKPTSLNPLASQKLTVQFAPKKRDGF